MPIKLIIFDFDGTLADSFGWFSSAFALAAQKYHFKVLSVPELEKLRGKSSREIMRELEIAWWKIPLIARFMRRHMHEQKPDIKLFSGIPELIFELKRRGMIVAIVTSNSQDNVRSILGAELARQIDYFECSVSLFGKKRRFKKLLRLTRLQPQLVLSIGDEIRDIEAGKIANVKTGAVTWGYANQEALSCRHPDYLFHRAEEILTVCSD